MTNKPETVAWIPVSERLPKNGRVEFYSDELKESADEVLKL